LDRDAIIGIALLIIVALIAINYFNVDCSSILERGAEIKSGWEEPERQPGKYNPFPGYSWEEGESHKDGGEGSDQPGEKPPIEPPPIPPPQPPGPPGP
jgi:hypothetical protein